MFKYITSVSALFYAGKGVRALPKSYSKIPAPPEQYLLEI